MTARIQILPEDLINRIAAGEVVERPASVVKELIDNALDAESGRITIEVEDGGKRMIRITDDGEGMSREDALLAFQRHATSKIRAEADLEAIATLGFRGEALPSIASVSRVRLITRRADEEVATRLVLEGGNLKETAEAASPSGTMVEVAQLFYNTPARRKFLKATGTELTHITGLVTELALAHPRLEFRLLHDGRDVFHFPAVEAWSPRAVQVFGAEMAEQLIPIEGGRGRIRVTGGVSRPHYTRGTKSHQFFFVNGRNIRDRLLAHAVYEAYDTLLMKGRHPIAVLFLELDPSLVDVNVHPAKREVRFRVPQEIHPMVTEAIRKALREYSTTGRPQEKVAGTEVRVSQSSAFWGGVEERKAEVREAAATYLRHREGMGSADPDRARSAGPSLSGWQAASGEQERIVPLGQILRSYIVAEVEGDLEIIDQHAAHERILYERLVSRMDSSHLSGHPSSHSSSHPSGHPEAQALLIPETLELSARDAVLLRPYLEKLKEIGLEIEEFGSTSFVLRSVPAILSTGLAQRDLRLMVLDLLDDLKEWDRAATAEEIQKRLAASLACHGAIRANDSLTRPEMSALLWDLQDYPGIHSCPHGRPIRHRFSRQDLEKMFGRR